MLERLDDLLSYTRRQLAAKDTGGWLAKERQLLESCHPKQRGFVLDQGRRVAALVARGGGKTTGGKVRFMRRLMRTPDAKCLYVATTRAHAEELMWAPLKDLCEKLEIAAHFNETKLKLKLRKNGAELRLVGADDKREIEKLRGLPHHEVGIDESASHPTQLLEHLIFRIIAPRLGDFGGALWLIGTPGHILSGPFYDATRPGSDISRPYDERHRPEFKDWQRWSFHHWSLQDNVKAPQLWQEALLEKEANGWSDQNPIWRREYLGQWAADDTENVYRYRPHLDDGQEWNLWTPGKKTKENPFGLPSGHAWRFVYGMDLGHSDPFALEVLAYADTCRTLYQVYEFTRKGMTVTQIASLIKDTIKVTGYPEGMVADTAGLGDMILKELSEVHGLAIEAAEKKNKHDAIELMNSDLVDGWFKVIKGSKLEEQLLSLQWAIDDAGRLKENKGQRNDACDATIYARRKAQHHHARSPDAPRPAKGTPEALNLEAREAEERIAEEDRRRDDPGFFGTDDFSEFFESDGFL